MGFMENVNRAFFNLTYNEKASQAYDEQNQKAAGAVEELKQKIRGYRETREKIIGSGEASDYFSSNSLARITEWENWLEKNGGLAAGDYSKKETEMKTQWDSILNVNKIVKEMSRVAPFIELYLKDKDTKIPEPQKKELVTLKDNAAAYYSKINKQTPSDIIAKRDEYNRKFEEIQKKIPENFEDLKEPYVDSAQAPTNLLQGIQENNFTTYKDKVENKELAEANSFNLKRLGSNIKTYFPKGFSLVSPYVFGTIFAMIVANDAIGRPAAYRFFYFFFMFLLFQVSLIPGFPFIVLVYYLYRALSAINWSNMFSFNPSGPRLDYLKAPVLFAFLPLFEAAPEEKVPWYISPFTYDVNRYDGLAKKKQLAYEMNAAKLVGKTVDPAMFGIKEETLEQVLCEIKSVLTGTKGTLEEAIDGLKKLF